MCGQRSPRMRSSFRKLSQPYDLFLQSYLHGNSYRHPVESSQHRRTRPPLCLARALVDWRVTRRQQTSAGHCRRVHFSRMLTLVARTVAPCGFRLRCGGWGGCGWAGTGSSVCARRCARPCARVSERLHRTCPLCACRVLERKRKGEGGGRGERPGGLRTV